MVTRGLGQVTPGCNQPLPRLFYGLQTRLLPVDKVGDCPEATIDIRLQCLPPSAHSRWPWFTGKPPLGADPGIVTWVVDERRIEYNYSDGTQFTVSRDGSEVWANWPEEGSLQNTLCYLYGPILGLVLHLRRTPTLHASAIVVDGRAAVLIGDSGAGKSTLAAAFACLGYAVLTEDIVALSPVGESVEVQPGYPLICLWPHAAELLFGSAEALPRLVPGWDKRYLDLNQFGYKFQSSPCPIGGIYILAERFDQPAAPYLRDVSSREALLALLANGYTSHLPADAEHRAIEFRAFAKIAAGVSASAVHPHKDPQRIFETCRLIAADMCGEGKQHNIDCGVHP